MTGMISLDYIAGVFDGEGNINYSCKHYQIVITNTNLEMLEQVQSFLNMGKIYTRKKVGMNKICFMYRIFKREEVCKFIEIFLPRVLIKRQDLEKIQEYLKNNPQVLFPKSWRKEEIETLQSLYFKDITWENIAKNLDRSKGSIRGALGKYVKGYPKSGDKYIPKKFIKKI